MELVIGRVAKSHGVRGELAVEVRTDEPELRFAPGAVLRARMPRSSVEQHYTVEAAREHSGRLLLSLKEIRDRAAADAIRGTLFLIDTADLTPSDDPDEFYDHELEGLRALLPNGSELGTVAEVLHSAAGELLSITTPAGREVLVPFVIEMVPEIDIVAGWLRVDPPDGLIDLDEPEKA